MIKSWLKNYRWKISTAYVKKRIISRKHTCKIYTQFTVNLYIRVLSEFCCAGVLVKNAWLLFYTLNAWEALENSITNNEPARYYANMWSIITSKTALVKFAYFDFAAILSVGSDNCNRSLGRTLFCAYFFGYKRRNSTVDKIASVEETELKYVLFGATVIMALFCRYVFTIYFQKSG